MNWAKALLWANTVYIVAICFAAAATILVSFFASRLSLQKDTELDRFRTQSATDIAKANLRAGEARAQAATATEGQKKLETALEQAKVRQEELRRQNLELQSEVEREHLARLQIEERLAPRKLTGGQIRAVAAKLLPFAGQKVQLVVSPPESEPMRIGDLILSALKESGWNPGTLVGSDVARSVSGILIEIKPGADQKTVAAAHALASALRSENLVVSGPQPADPHSITGVFTGGEIKDAKIMVTIGSK
jgi:hypothetical protein